MASGKPAIPSDRWQGPGAPRLLLVDDDETMRRSSARFLVRAGFEVVSVDGGRAALALLDGGANFEAAVIDLEMPEMDGVDLMRALAARMPGLPMGLWSASERVEHLTREELALAWFVTPKMRPIGELVQEICRAIYGARRRSALEHPSGSSGGGETRRGQPNAAI